jgi:hypothetical protein
MWSDEVMYMYDDADDSRTPVGRWLAAHLQM